MKLLGSDGSPYVRKARVAIAEKGVACEFVAASPRDPASGVAAANPLAKIPTLLLDDGTAIYDSSAGHRRICRRHWPRPETHPGQFRRAHRRAAVGSLG